MVLSGMTKRSFHRLTFCIVQPSWPENPSRVESWLVLNRTQWTESLNCLLSVSSLGNLNQLLGGDIGCNQRDRKEIPSALIGQHEEQSGESTSDPMVMSVIFFLPV